MGKGVRWGAFGKSLRVSGEKVDLKKMLSQQKPTAPGTRIFPYSPRITNYRLENATRAFVDGILRALKSKAQGTSFIQMDLYIWRYVVEGKGVPCSHRGHYLYKKDDFNRFSVLPADW